MDLMFFPPVYHRAMDTKGFVEGLAAQQGSEASLAHVETLRSRDPLLEPLPEVPDVLRRRLGLLGIEGLYPHQREAIGVLERGDNVIVATGTASGKTLVYNLVFARTALTDEKRTALYLFPTKALARDQLRQVRDLKLPQVRAAVYDGDTPQAERPLIRRNANLVMTNPDMLHASILPGHPRWADFFLRLSLVVVDEAHVAKGVFGSHVAMILRRLRRLVAHYGGQPQFVLSSATIGNPSDLAERLVGLPFEQIDRDGSPRGEKLFVLWNPPLIDEELGLRRSAVTEASWMLRGLVEQEVRTIAFCRSRRAAELVAEFARRELPGSLKRRVKAYRAGYLPGERRELERALASGELLGVAATTALELGIDVGSLDAALLTGYPGTRASMWQQAGRAGRRSDSSLAMLIAQDDPLDQYLVQHPSDLFEKPPEAVVVDPTNPYVLEPHMACAAREQPMTEEEVEAFGEGATDAVERLVAGGELFWRRGLLYHRGRESPHRRVDIRSASGSLFAIVDAETGALLGTVDEARAFWHVHPGAVYLHQGEQYEVSELDLQRRVALVGRSDADYYTQIRDITDVEVLRAIDQGAIGDVPALFGEVKVTRQVVGFQRKLSSTQEVIDEVMLDLPPQTLTTKALWWILPRRLLLRARITAASLPGTAHAAEHAAIGLLPLVATCDRWDVGGCPRRSIPTRAQQRSSSTTGTREAPGSPSAATSRASGSWRPRSRPSGSAHARRGVPRASSPRSAGTATSPSTSLGRWPCSPRCSGERGGEGIVSPVYVAVCGPDPAPPDVATQAEQIGRLLAGAGAVLVCGGLGGTMEAAARGVQAEGGTSIGILPGSNRSAANPHISLSIPTGMGEMRNALIIRSADAVIAVAGEFGTLSEIAFALKTGVPVVGLGTWELAKPGRMVPDPIVRASTPEEAVELALRLARAR